MERVIKAITVRASDYKDNDKIIKLFTPDGIISAQAKGVKKAGAKLKFCVQPFCFFEAVLHENNGFNTVTGAMLIDSFFDLTQEYERYLAAAAILETLDAYERTYCGKVFINVLKFFEALLSARPKEVLIKYLLESLKITGYQYVYDRCSNCGGSFVNRIWFDFSNGAVCDICKPADCAPVSKAAHSVIRIIEETGLNKIGTVKLNGDALNEALALMGVIYKENNNINIKSLTSLIN